MHFFRITRSRLSGLAALALSSLVPVIAWAVCTCGFGDGRLTLVSINVNGNMNDWAPVHFDDRAFVLLRRNAGYDQIIRREEYQVLRPGGIAETTVTPANARRGLMEMSLTLRAQTTID